MLHKPPGFLVKYEDSLGLEEISEDGAKQFMLGDYDPYVAQNGASSSRLPPSMGSATN